MRVSLNTIKQLTGVDLPLDVLVEKINTQLGAIEEVTDLGAKYKDAVIIKVVSAEKHPDADRLYVTKVDDGGAVADIKRDDDGYVQVVCGAPNVRAGMFAVWLPPKSTVPSTFDDKDPFVLDARELRGVVSQGMLAAADELAIGTDHEGIIEIDPDEWKPNDVGIVAGTSFAKAYELDDTIIDIENKMFTHRPDLFGQLGVAREIFAITQPPVASDNSPDIRFEEQDWFWAIPSFVSASGLELHVANEAPDKVPRLMAVAMDDVTVRPSPLWVQAVLIRWGSKPINNIVDLTNYIMLLTAQPTHAYDYDKLHGHTLGARMARDDESITLLNGKTYTLSSDDIVMIDGEGPIGLGGIMGGSNSEVSANTTRIVLEVANFDMYTVRKSSMRHGLFTEALTRFNKGQSLLQTDRVLARLIELMPGKQSSDVFDLPKRAADFDKTTNCKELRISTAFINARLGLTLTTREVGNILRLVNFASYPSDEDEETLLVTAPFWRTDIELPEDVVEEVGRLYGFDKLPRELPQRSIEPAAKNTGRELKQKVRNVLASAGANEVLTYSFVHENVLRRAGQNPDEAYQLSNALSPDLQFYRLSLTPSLLDKVYGNIRAGFDAFALFEIGTIHTKQADLDADGLPAEIDRIGFVVSSKQPPSGAAYYKAKHMLDYVAEKLGLDLAYKPLPADTTTTMAQPFYGPRSARVIDTKSNQPLGIIGEYKQSVRRAFKLPEYSAGFELSFEGLLLAIDTDTSRYQPLGRYPSISRDVTFVIDASMNYDSVIKASQGVKIDQSVTVHIEPKDIYQAEGHDSRHITLTYVFTPHDQTLKNEYANQLLGSIVSNIESTTNARVLS